MPFRWLGPLVMANFYHRNVGVWAGAGERGAEFGGSSNGLHPQLKDDQVGEPEKYLGEVRTNI